jgi:hypothetical protein
MMHSDNTPVCQHGNPSFCNFCQIEAQLTVKVANLVDIVARQKTRIEAQESTIIGLEHALDRAQHFIANKTHNGFDS